MSIILFFLVLFVLILVHEWGHFIVAKKTGMRVDEFGIGFPPKLTGIKKGETEYTFNLLPIGGFVRIYGENLDTEIGGDDPDSSRSFAARPKWAQALVLIAGVTMNIVFAWFLFSITLMIGVPTAVDENSASEKAQLYVAATLPDSPANEVLPAGAVIEAVGSGERDLQQLTPSAFSNFVGEVSPEPVIVSYRYGDVSDSVQLIAQQNLLPDDPEKYLIGTSLALIEDHKLGLFPALYEGLLTTMDGLTSITVGLGTLITQAFVGQADFTQVAGPVGIVSMVDDAASFGFTALLTFTAIISLNLAVINLLPFPALDGGRLVFVVIEAVTRKRIPSVWASRVNLIGFGILMLLMVAVTYNDIVRLL